jgi:hypothetical protein
MTISRLLHASQITVGYTRPRKEVAVDLSLYLAPGELVCLHRLLVRFGLMTLISVPSSPRPWQ